MKYIIFAEDGKEYGPVDPETLHKWVENGRVLPHTQVRNMMMKKWNRASDLAFLKDAFEKQVEKVEENKGVFEHEMDSLKSIFRSKKAEISKGTVFKASYLPNPASLSLRLGAFIFDMILILGYALLLILVFSLLMKAGFCANAEATNRVFLLICLALFAGILLYYALSLGLYAQSFGMWFWGIMLVSSDLGEVFLGRAYLHTVLMLLLGITAPLIVYLSSDKRSLHEYLSGTKVIGIAAKPKS